MISEIKKDDKETLNEDEIRELADEIATEVSDNVGGSIAAGMIYDEIFDMCVNKKIIETDN